jgi:hypothetical protein
LAALSWGDNSHPAHFGQHFFSTYAAGQGINFGNQGVGTTSAPQALPGCCSNQNSSIAIIFSIKFADFTSSFIRRLL